MNHNAIVTSPSLPFRPLKRLVFIKPDVQTTVQSGALTLVLPRISGSMPSTGVVLAMSEIAQKELPDVKPGDRVLFKKQQQFLADDQQTTIVDCDFVEARLDSNVYRHTMPTATVDNFVEAVGMSRKKPH